MNNTATAVVITFSALAFVCSATTLAVVLVGGKQMVKEVEVGRAKINYTVKKAKQALSALEDL